MTLDGWTSCWLSPYEQVPLSEEKKRLLVECIRYRHYNFTYQQHQTLSYCAPFYSDNTICCLNKSQWDEIMAEAYQDETLGVRLMPQDVIKTAPVNMVLYEKRKKHE